MVPERYRSLVDEITVSKLESLAPGVSSQDRKIVETLMAKGEIFVSVKDEDGRNTILGNIVSQTSLIPTLRTFFEDQKYLEPCSLILKSLLDFTEKRPLWRAFSANYWPPPEIVAQHSEVVYSPLSKIRDEDAGMRLAYTQLWLASSRYFAELTSIKPRIESRKAQRIRRDHDTARLEQLGLLAYKLGFRTSRTLELSLKVADWPDELLKVKASSGPLINQNLPFTSNDSLPLERRSGRPFDNDYDNDRVRLFSFMFYDAVQPGEDITPLFVKRNIFEAFLRPFIPDVSISR
jgi:hypothetical protein